VTEYVRTFKEYKTQFIYDLFDRIDYEQDRIVQYPDKAIATMILKSAHVVFLTDVGATEYEGISDGVVIKTDEENTVPIVDTVYFLKSDLKILDPTIFKYHHENVPYIPPSKVFDSKDKCRDAHAAEPKTISNPDVNTSIEASDALKETSTDATRPKDVKFTFDKARTIRNAWTSFKVGYAVLRQENLPDNVLAALYELNSLRKKYRRMKPEKLKEIVAAKHGISVKELSSSLQSRVNYMKHAKRAFQQIWGAE